jgi:hypothetical protein
MCSQGQALALLVAYKVERLHGPRRSTPLHTSLTGRASRTFARLGSRRQILHVQRDSLWGSSAQTRSWVRCKTKSLYSLSGDEGVHLEILTRYA